VHFLKSLNKYFLQWNWRYRKKGDVVIHKSHPRNVPLLGVEPRSSRTVVFCAFSCPTSTSCGNSAYRSANLKKVGNQWLWSKSCIILRHRRQYLQETLHSIFSFIRETKNLMKSYTSSKRSHLNYQEWSMGRGDRKRRRDREAFYWKGIKVFVPFL